MNNNMTLTNASAKPYLRIAKEPENPISDRRNGLQKGHVTLKKLKKAPKNPTFADFNILCLFLMAKTCNEMRIPPKIENAAKNVILTAVNEKVTYFNPDLISIKFVITA